MLELIKWNDKFVAQPAYYRQFASMAVAYNTLDLDLKETVFEAVFQHLCDVTQRAVETWRY